MKISDDKQVKTNQMEVSSKKTEDLEHEQRYDSNEQEG